MPDDIEQEDPHPDYAKGFNEGYLLSAYAPEVGALFGAYAPETERGRGFRAGKESFAPQPKKEPYPNYLKDASDNAKDMDLKDSPEMKMAEFRQNKEEQGLARESYPDWMREMDESKEDMDLDRETNTDIRGKEPEKD